MSIKIKINEKITSTRTIVVSAYPKKDGAVVEIYDVDYIIDEQESDECEYQAE